MKPLVLFHPHIAKRLPNARSGWIVTDDGCHIWQGSVFPNGYGSVWHNGRNRPVHRARYEREVGPVPEGLVLDHFVCDNRLCCNPAHVRPVSQRENLLRSATTASINAAKDHCKRGHALSGDNLRVNRQLARVCLACERMRESVRPRRTRGRTAARAG